MTASGVDFLLPFRGMGQEETNEASHGCVFFGAGFRGQIMVDGSGGRFGPTVQALGVWGEAMKPVPSTCLTSA